MFLLLALEFTGGVPYDILKPILERATSDQLFMLEHHNPYLIEDTDILWQYHCNREFRNNERQEMESWREMYMVSELTIIKYCPKYVQSFLYEIDTYNLSYSYCNVM